MTPNQSGDEAFLIKITAIIETHLENERLGVSELARMMGMSRSNLHRKIKAVSGMSASQFIREQRLGKAMELLKESSFTVAEVAYKVGFGSVTYFIKCFRDHFGYTPGEAARHAGSDSYGRSDRPGPLAGPGKAGYRSLLWFISGVILILAASIYLIIAKPFSRIKPAGNVAIMVLPFRNDSPGEADDYIINGLMDEIRKAKGLLEKAVVLDSAFVEAYDWLANIYIEQLFYTVLSSNPGRSYAYQDTGLCYTEKALQVDPENSWALALKGRCFQRKGNHEEAERLFEAAFRNEPSAYKYYRA